MSEKVKIGNMVHVHPERETDELYAIALEMLFMDLTAFLKYNGMELLDYRIILEKPKDSDDSLSLYGRAGYVGTVQGITPGRMIDFRFGEIFKRQMKMEFELPKFGLWRFLV